MALKKKWIVRFCEREKDILHQLIWPDSLYVTSYNQPHTCRLFISVALLLGGLSCDSHVLLIIYSHEFTCIHNLPTFLLFIRLNTRHILVVESGVYNKSRLHMCFPMDVKIGQKKKDKQVKKEQNYKTQIKRFIWYEL